MKSTDYGYQVTHQECAPCRIERKQSGYGQPLPPVDLTIYQSNSHFQVPEFYALPEEDIRRVSSPVIPGPVEFNFTGQLRDYQTDIITRALALFEKNGVSRCLMCMPTGSGKTVTALNLVSKLQHKTLIIVHKSFLVDQWKLQIEQFFGGAVSVGMIRGSTWDVDHPIVIGMLQTLCRRDPAKFKAINHGLTIVDECHHIASTVFSGALKQYCTKALVGLSATPRRADGLDPALQYFFGPFLKLSDTTPKQQAHVHVMDPKVTIPRLELYNGKTNYQGMLNKLVESDYRNEQIVHEIQKLCNDSRHVLIVTDRVSHCTEIAKRMDRNCNLFIGSTSREDRERAIHECITDRIPIIATYQMVAEAFDVPVLNALVLATPKRDIVQVCGRILRKKHDRPPIIVDFYDESTEFRSWWFARLRYYREQNYKIHK